MPLGEGVPDGRQVCGSVYIGDNSSGFVLPNPPHKPFDFNTSVCTVDLLKLNAAAAARTVASCCAIYSPQQDGPAAPDRLS